jgi:hypothetical protein
VWVHDSTSGQSLLNRYGICHGVFPWGIWRDGRDPGYVQLVDKFCLLIFGAAVHQCRGVWVDFHVLRSFSLCFDGCGNPNDHVREEMENSLRTEVLSLHQ